jgi:hypothetical protein
MVLGDVVMPRVEPADRGQGAIPTALPLILGEPSSDRLSHQRSDRLPRCLCPLLELPSHIIGELNLHTLHVQNGSVLVNPEVEGVVRSIESCNAPMRSNGAVYGRIDRRPWGDELVAPERAELAAGEARSNDDTAIDHEAHSPLVPVSGSPNCVDDVRHRVTPDGSLPSAAGEYVVRASAPAERSVGCEDR